MGFRTVQKQSSGGILENTCFRNFKSNKKRKNSNYQYLHRVLYQGFVSVVAKVVALFILQIIQFADQVKTRLISQLISSIPINKLSILLALLYLHSQY